MQRIAGVSDEDAGLFAKFAFWFCRRLFGRVVSSLRVNAVHTDVLAAVGGYEFMAGRASRVDPALKSLATLRVASMIGCPF